MQWKSYILVFLIASPLTAMAQKDANKITTNGRQIALLDKSIKPEQVVVIKSGQKEVSSSKLILAHDSETKAALAKKQNAKVALYKPVPLIGQLDYYGKKNAYMIDYCSSYLSNFGQKLASVSKKEKTFKVIEGILAKNHIPKELEYLAVIESALNGHARSPVGATGYWQFMSGTARHMGLVVNRHRDDRKNLYKSTVAAVKYLEYLYERLDDWLLVVAAYNCGAGRLERDIDRAGGKKDFWAVKKYLPRETQNHVLAFIATATIMERLAPYMESGLPKRFDWSSLQYDSPDDLKKALLAPNANRPLIKRFGLTEVKKMALVRIEKPLSLQVLASVLKVDASTINRWNYDYHDYLTHFKTGNTYNLKIPKSKLDLFFAKKRYIHSASNKMMY